MRRIALVLEYDGTAFAGSQWQPGARTVQGELETALARFLGEPTRAAFAGRTDTGVHALGQVAAFSTERPYPVATAQRALNALLPDDLAVTRAVEAPLDFDPRRQARRRWYRYTIANAPARSPLRRRTSWPLREPLDVAAMGRALAALVGEHDLASFGAALLAGRSSIRRVFHADVRQEGTLVEVDIEATAFLPHQVRRTVGALAEIGGGRLPEGCFADWLARPQPGRAGPTAPPQGLCLMRVTYEHLDVTP